uniref:IQ domain-containing protein C isoform X2 n=1 Tax=Myxine glutinosa TaxID=7769 RepID=UPI00358FD192
MLDTWPEGGVIKMQAMVRGALTRRAMANVLKDFEAMVVEVEGSASTLHWVGSTLTRPCFNPKHKESQHHPSIAGNLIVSASVSGPHGVVLSSPSPPDHCTNVSATTIQNHPNTSSGPIFLHHSRTSDGLPHPDTMSSTMPPSTDPTANVMSHDHLLHPLEGRSNAFTTVHPQVLSIPPIGVSSFMKDNEETAERAATKETWRDGKSATAAMEEDVDLMEEEGLPTSDSGLRDLCSSLTMDVLWLQQAIKSRKDYLNLKRNMS